MYINRVDVYFVQRDSIGFMDGYSIRIYVIMVAWSVIQDVDFVHAVVRIRSSSGREPVVLSLLF